MTRMAWVRSAGSGRPGEQVGAVEELDEVGGSQDGDDGQVVEVAAAGPALDARMVRMVRPAVVLSPPMLAARAAIPTL